MNKDPHLGKPPSNGSSDSDGPNAPHGSASPAESGSGPSASSSNGGGARRRHRSTRSGPSFVEAAASGWRHALALGDYARTLVQVRVDRAALEMRRKATKIGVLSIVAVGAATIVIAGSLRVVSGASEGFARLFGQGAWLGDLVAGVVLLGGLAAVVAFAVNRRERKELEQQLEKYEHHHSEHRRRHGRFVGDPSPADPRGTPRA